MVTEHLFFYVGVNSIRADNLSPLVSRILNKKEVNIFAQFLSYFFEKKPLSWRVGYVMDGSMGE